MHNYYLTAPFWYRNQRIIVGFKDMSEYGHFLAWMHVQGIKVENNKEVKSPDDLLRIKLAWNTVRY
jgi:hypothetical protein